MDRVIVARHTAATCPGRPCGEDCDHVEYAPEPNQVPFTDLEYDQLSYLLDMLRNDLTSGIKVVERLQPACTHIERMRKDVEATIDFIARIEHR